MRVYAPTIFCYALVLHMFWAVNVFVFGEESLSSAQLYLFYMFESRWLLGSFYVLCVVSALYGNKLWHKKYYGLALCCFLPQQFSVIVSVMSAVARIILGAFVDGIERHFSFILSVQAPLIIASFSYTFALAGRVRAWRVEARSS